QTLPRFYLCLLFAQPSERFMQPCPLFASSVLHYTTSNLSYASLLFCSVVTLCSSFRLRVSQLVVYALCSHASTSPNCAASEHPSAEFALTIHASCHRVANLLCSRLRDSF